MHGDMVRWAEDGDTATRKALDEGLGEDVGEGGTFEGGGMDWRGTTAEASGRAALEGPCAGEGLVGSDTRDHHLYGSCSDRDPHR